MSFAPTDYIIVLVDGRTNQSSMFGYGGTASLYRAPGPMNTPANPTLLTFSPVSENVNVERRSARNIQASPNDYGALGHVPPGVYGLFYRRLDPTHGGRHRIGLSDRLCNPAFNDCGACSVVKVSVGGTDVQRLGLQFHIAYNDLNTYDPDVSEGCITLTRANWETLFTPDFTDPNTSPLYGCRPDGRNYNGMGRVMTFITDAADTQGKQARQKALFQKWLTLSLNDKHFRDSSREWADLRKEWTNA